MIRGGQNVCGGPLRHLKQLGFYSRFSEKPLNVQKSVAGDQYVFERTREKGGGNKCQFSRRCSFPVLQNLGKMHTLSFLENIIFCTCYGLNLTHRVMVFGDWAFER